MNPLDEAAIRDSFVNCSKGEARRLAVPRALAAPDRGYLVAERDGALIGVTLRSPVGIRRSLVRSNVCSICITAHSGSGVALLVARRAGPAGREGNTVGAYICADLACSLYVRGLRRTQLAQRLTETLTLDEQIDRTRTNLDVFLDQILV
jgi:hypothetical protein